MIQNDVVNELVPSQNGCDLIESTFSHFYPENFMLNLKLQFRFKSSGFLSASGVIKLSEKNNKGVTKRFRRSV